jgi:elongator complex protein 3
MPGLPKTEKERDLLGMIHLFASQDYRPDMLKIYPCMVIPNTPLCKLWKKKKYKPMTTKQAAELIAEFKPFVPRYVRIMRVQRDIPTFMTAAGVDRTNLRQYIAALKPECECIRCREIGKKKIKGKPELQVMHYEASKGSEFFISLETKDNILGFCRLRFPSVKHGNIAIVRELHVYGEATAIGKKGKTQHKGFGKILLQQAEHSAKDYHRDKIMVISGVGVRNYYRKQGYKKEGHYMVKKL